MRFRCSGGCLLGLLFSGGLWNFFYLFFLVRTVRYLLYKLSNWLSSVLIKFRFS